MLLLLATGLRPCVGQVPCEDEHPAPEAVNASVEKAHACCQRFVGAAHESGDDEHSPVEDDSCADGCDCYCCVLVVAPTVGIPPLYAPRQAEQLQAWHTNFYAHDFTDMIWQPPQLG